MIKNVREIVKKKECTGCGSCSAYCKKITMVRNSEGYNNPEIAESCTNCGSCLIVCPRENSKTEYNDNNFCKVIKVEKSLVCYSNNEIIRNKSASGGFITQFLVNLLNNGIIDGAIVADSDGTLENTKAVIATTENEIINSQSSKYFPISIVSAIEKIDKTKKYAFVGKGCDVKGLTLLTEKIKKLQNIIIVKIGLMCAATPSAVASEKLYKNMTNREYCQGQSKLFYRYNGWPGDAVATFEDIEYSMPYKISWCQNLSHNHGIHCDTCIDHFAENADIVVGDAWFKNKDLKNTGGGYSLVVPLNKTAKELISANDANIITSYCNYEDVLNSQENLFKRQDIAYLFHYVANFFRHKNYFKIKFIIQMLKKYSYKVFYYYFSMRKRVYKNKK